jgi:NADPH-dependent 2,4-dienoyl-CoA reductase/sulfur reductase-like enzyme/nitrite reductase/ring-hydroxylating ferredoxin subunit
MADTPSLLQVPSSEVLEGRAKVHTAGAESVLVVRAGGKAYATAATCSHYGGPLAEGLVAGATVRCPWHHACFDLATGLASGPAMTPIACYDVVEEGGVVHVLGKRAAAAPAPAAGPVSVVIIGGGVAGAACAEALRRNGYAGPVTLVADEPPGPVDRPNLSKEYLVGTAPEEWIPLRDAAFYAEHRIDFVLGDPAVRIDPRERTVALRSGRALSYGALVLATGAEARRLDLPGAVRPNVHTLRTLADARAIIARAKEGARAVVIGASFIGLEVAASLRARKVEVEVVGPEAVPLARIVGEKIGRFVRSLHEAKGVRFHLGRRPAAIGDAGVTLDDGAVLPADFVVAGVGVAPRTALAAAAGITLDRGVAVDERLQTSEPGVFAIGDIARYPDPWSGERVRIEHFAAAQRQGQALARMLLGGAGGFRDVPFFWSAHYDTTLSYVGHAEAWDQVLETGSLEERAYSAAFEKGGKVLAVVCVGKDALGLEVEAAMERGDAAGVAALVRRG